MAIQDEFPDIASALADFLRHAAPQADAADAGLFAQCFYAGAITSVSVIANGPAGGMIALTGRYGSVKAELEAYVRSVMPVAS